MRADFELDIGRKTFASGLLPELIAVLRRCRPEDLIAIVGDEEGVGSELETWFRFTGNSLLETTIENGRTRWVFRYGAVAVPAGVPGEDNRPVGSRLWLYTNFDCNLHCDYCCVRSSPTATRRELGLARVQRIGAWRQRNLRDRRRAVSAGRHRRHSAFLRCSRPDHGADQRNALCRATARKLASVAQ
jgi:hypothetical protein